jgi:hypothetical protein
VTELKTDTQAPAPRLSDVDESERNRLFSRLQERMPAVWDAIRLGLEDESVVVVPSVTLDPAIPGAGSLSQAFEERFLFLLLLLRQPWLRMIYVTSMPIKPSILEYYLALLPGVIPSHAIARLNLLSVGDSSPVPLSAKLLERPRMLSKISAMIPNRQRSHLIPYSTSALERDIALTLGIPMYGTDPRLAGGREKLDNLIFVINCNLQRLDGPVRGNGKIIQELEGIFRGAGWNVIKVIWGTGWDRLIAADKTGLLLKRMEECVDGEYGAREQDRLPTAVRGGGSTASARGGGSAQLRGRDRCDHVDA